MLEFELVIDIIGSSRPRMKRTVPNGAISKSTSFEPSLALVLVVPSPFPPCFVAAKDFVGLVWWIFIIFQFLPVFAKKKGNQKHGWETKNKRRGTETGIDTTVYGPKETSSAICLVAIAFLILARSNFVGSGLFIGIYSK